MVCGCDDSKLHCYVWHETNFTEVLTLDGHGDWIRGVDMTTTGGSHVDYKCLTLVLMECCMRQLLI